MSGPGIQDTEPRPSLSYEDVAIVSDFYELGAVRADEWQPNPRGLINESFELSGRYFLTAYGGRSQEEVEAIAGTANGLEPAIPMARPVLGAEGYTVELSRGNSLLTPYLPGEHFVGLIHTYKHPIPDRVHRVLADFFWDVQRGLSGTPDELKDILQGPSRANKSTFPSEIPGVARSLERFAPETDVELDGYVDLIHDDMERQNILVSGDRVTGLVDLDSIHKGNILYEFGHYFFNLAFCDPCADFTTASIYMDGLRRDGTIRPEDIPTLYEQMYKFAMADIAEFQDLIENSSIDSKRLVDLEVLTRQYEKALMLADRYFQSEHPAS